MIECLRMVLDKVGQPLSRPRFALAFESSAGMPQNNLSKL